MQFESDYRFDMDDSFSLCSQPMSCSSTTSSFSSASSTNDPFTPHNFIPHQVELTLRSSAMGKLMFSPAKAESEDMRFSGFIPNTTMKREQLGFEYEHMIDMHMAHRGSMGSLTPSNSFGTYGYSPDAFIDGASFMMTPVQSLSGSEAGETDPSWSCANNRPISFFPNKQLASEFYSLDLDQQSRSPMGHSRHPNSPNRMRAQRKMMVETQQRSEELQRPHSRSSRKRSIKPDPTHGDVVRRAMCKCDYPGCHKAFRRNEHLKRHKQTFHGEGPNRFSCEFCGKDQFNRRDNLNNHRKLHARPNSRNRGVEFIPAAVPIIEQEERRRK